MHLHSDAESIKKFGSSFGFNHLEYAKLMAREVLIEGQRLKQKRNNMNKTLLTVLTGAALSFAVQQAEAATITGSIDMSGTAILDNTSLGSATKVNSITGATVGGIPTGSFTGTGGDSVNWNGFGWNPSTTPVTPLWSFTDAGTGSTYSFTLNSISVESQSNTFLNLLGNGKLSITGGTAAADDTYGKWSFTISNPTGGKHSNFAFTFANSQTAVPDGGATAMLLGAGFLGLAGLRRKLS